jgi:hypothetical protein
MIKKEYLKNDDEATISLEYTPEAVFIHLDLKIWGRKVLRRIDKELIKIGKKLKEKGYKNLYACNENEDEKWIRFITLVGFTFAFLVESKSIFAYDLRRL